MLPCTNSKQGEFDFHAELQEDSHGLSCQMYVSDNYEERKQNFFGEIMSKMTESVT